MLTVEQARLIKTELSKGATEVNLELSIEVIDYLNKDFQRTLTSKNPKFMAQSFMVMDLLTDGVRDTMLAYEKVPAEAKLVIDKLALVVKKIAELATIAKRCTNMYIADMEKDPDFVLYQADGALAELIALLVTQAGSESASTAQNKPTFH